MGKKEKVGVSPSERKITSEDPSTEDGTLG